MSMRPPRFLALLLTVFIGGTSLFAAGFRKGDLVINTFAYHLTPGGWIGQTIAGVASFAGVMLVWTGLMLSWRRFVAWRARTT